MQDLREWSPSLVSRNLASTLQHAREVLTQSQEEVIPPHRGSLSAWKELTSSFHSG